MVAWLFSVIPLALSVPEGVLAAFTAFVAAPTRASNTRRNSSDASGWGVVAIVGVGTSSCFLFLGFSFGFSRWQ